MTPRVRDYRVEDAETLGAIYLRAVTEGTAGFYDPDQRRVWAGYWPGGGSWAERLQGYRTWVAEVGDVPVGFVSLGEGGHLELLFVLPECMGRGVAGTLYDAFVGHARALGLTRLDTDASHLAHSFLRRRGWTELERQDQDREGVVLTTFRMQKRLD